MSMIDESGDRVRSHTAPRVQEKIDRKTERNVHRYAVRPRLQVDRRLQQLDREWDIERVLEANASTLALAGVVLGATVSKRWLLLSAGVLGFLLMHAIQGWCPPVPVLRRLGVRTQREIDRERFALGGFSTGAAAGKPGRAVGPLGLVQPVQ